MHEMRAYWGFDCTYGFRMIILLSGYKLGMKLCGWVVGSPELCVSYLPWNTLPGLFRCLIFSDTL